MIQIVKIPIAFRNNITKTFSSIIATEIHLALPLLGYPGSYPILPFLFLGFALSSSN